MRHKRADDSYTSAGQAKTDTSRSRARPNYVCTIVRKVGGSRGFPAYYYYYYMRGPGASATASVTRRPVPIPAIPTQKRRPIRGTIGSERHKKRLNGLSSRMQILSSGSSTCCDTILSRYRTTKSNGNSHPPQEQEERAHG